MVFLVFDKAVVLGSILPSELFVVPVEAKKSRSRHEECIWVSFSGISDSVSSVELVKGRSWVFSINQLF